MFTSASSPGVVANGARTWPSSSRGSQNAVVAVPGEAGVRAIAPSGDEHAIAHAGVDAEEVAGGDRQARRPLAPLASGGKRHEPARRTGPPGGAGVGARESQPHDALADRAPPHDHAVDG